MKITVLQRFVKENGFEENHQSALKAIAEVNDSDLIVLPELFTCGYNQDSISECARCSQQLYADFAALSSQKECAILAGSMAISQDGQTHNQSTFWNKKGELQAFYNKIHLFRLLNEDKYFCAGNQIVFTDYAGWRIGILICYDLRFAELAGILAQQGCNLLIIPAAWPADRIAVFKQLAIARAIENQLWVVAVNRASSKERTTYGGNSLIIAPDGEIVAEAGVFEQTIKAEIDLDRVIAYRKAIPCISDRRHDLYELKAKTQSTIPN